MSLYRRQGSDRWVSEMTIHGQRFRRSTGTSDKRAAKEIEARWRVEILTGRAVAPLQPPVQSLTVGEAVARYWTHELEPRQPKAKTERSARYNLALIPAYFGEDTPLDAITAPRISEWRASMLSAGCLPSTVNRRLSDLRAILRKNHKAGLLQSVPQVDMCRLPSPSERYLSDEELVRILQHCPPHLHRLVLFLANVGTRLGETTELRWSHVADDCSSVMLTRTKGKRSRTVPLCAEVRAMLQAMPRGRPEQHVFTYEGRPFQDPKRAWQRVRSLAGVEWATIHSLRHRFASALVRRNVPIYTVSKLLGHASISTTMRYSHLSTGDLAKAVAVLDN